MKTFSILAVTAIGALLIGAADPQGSEDLLWEHRNLGKAFYENPDTHLQAVEQLRAALELRPNSVRERINFGIALLRAGQIEAGMSELKRAQAQDPSIPHTWFNLGIGYKHAGDYDNAIEQLRGMIRLVPDEPKSHYNLAAVLRSKGDTQEAVHELLRAEQLDPNLAGPHFQLFTIYQRAGDKVAAAKERQLFEEVKKRNEGAAVPEDMEWSFYAELYDPPEPRPSAETAPTKYKDQSVSAGWDAANSHLALIDSQGNGHADLLVWSPERALLLKRGTEAANGSGLDHLRGIRDIAIGDFDNDGLADLCVLTATGASIYKNNHGTFAKFLDLPNTAGATKALWLDYDHDYDLDLLLFGPQPVLMRNDGDGKFEEKTSAFPFVKGNALDATVFTLRGETPARDVVVSYADQSGILYRDQLNGVFETEQIPALNAGAASVSAVDFNRDGLMDLIVYKPEVLAIKNAGGKLVAAGRPTGPVSSVRADFNGDNREDYARILGDGTVHVFLNDSPDEHWIQVRLQGVKNLKEGRDATVEVKSGAYYEKRLYAGVPISFATDARAETDTVRITWPNGLIQNETQKKSDQALLIPEAQRLSGSCPMIFAWNGQKFQFITDVLGVAPLGASSGDGNYFPVNHREHIQIPGSALAPKEGEYEIHITEELHEVSYLDQVQLIAVDHPSDLDIYTNDKFKSPPYPEFRLFGSRLKTHPLRATEDSGADVTQSLSRQDHIYPIGFEHNSSGVAALHKLDLDFGKAAQSNRAALVLNGWVDWADGSTFLNASQNGKGGLIFPYVQVQDSTGNWKTVVDDMGIPSGKPKTIVVDLTGKFLSAARKVRIVTNLCVYWDEIFLIDDARAPHVRVTPLEADAADLHFRGFSELKIDPTRQQPEQFNYDRVHFLSNWNPTPGYYTRYGDVKNLITQTDDTLLIMGSGDEVKIRYPASHLPALPTGWRRDFLLSVDGWAKDADANTAYSQSVLPLPFHAMSTYPYKPNEHFPSDPAHEQYVQQYLTRPALKLIRPLNSRGGEIPGF
jgi:tetratricopeptide (TPR) repeat protein